MNNMETKRTKGCSHELEDCYDVFWDECKSIHTDSDLSGQQDVETKGKEPERGQFFMKPFIIYYICKAIVDNQGFN